MVWKKRELCICLLTLSHNRKAWKRENDGRPRVLRVLIPSLQY